MIIVRFLILIGLVLGMSGCSHQGEEARAPSLNLADYAAVDLSHPYDEDTIYWPNSPSGFELEELSNGHVAGGWFYASFAFFYLNTGVRIWMPRGTLMKMGKPLMKYRYSG